MDTPPHPEMPLLRRLATLLARPVSPSDRQRAALHVLDWAGCAVAGAASPAGRLLAEHAARIGTGPCAGVGRPGLSASAAAFFNGGVGNVLEMDDIHRTSILHPGPVVVPAALAEAMATGAPPARLLDAVARGYEAMIRIGASVGPGHYALWHNTSTCGPFGAAAAAAAVLELDEEATVWALGNAGAQASGPWRCRHEPVMTKQLHTARAAQSGLQAAELAALGFTGPAGMLEGAQGFYAAMCPDPRPEVVTAEPDGPWRMWDVGFKPWPACRHAHPTIDAALALRRRGVAADAVRSIAVRTYDDALRFCDRPEPATVIQAKFSLQHSVAVVLLDGPPPLEAFEPPAIAREDVARLRAATTVAAGEPFVSAYPERYGAAVSVTLANGETLTETAPDALGDPANPVDIDRLTRKARALILSAGHSDTAADRLIETALALPNAGTLADFAAALATPPARPTKDTVQ
ncbi:MmgE/PrpD family protein [Acuticoccus sediminis]|uniref:MmgE/PrpD family protein n=1 Tax=Acuticoccus sediminis TaxID=2184697 RepID=UPI001CFD440D|nr:MmgE/PrpD family protein [Acuticoccus sediminis]